MAAVKTKILVALLVLPLLGACGAQTPAPAPSTPPVPSKPAPVSDAPLKDLETKYGARLGLVAINTATGQTLVHRQDERFPMLSTFKAYAAAALLHEHPLSSGYFAKVIKFGKADILPNSPVSSTRVATGMTVAELCEATITKSDNTAGNQILKLLGGPGAVTKFARSIGDPMTRLDRWEPDLNTAIPGDERDTTTPAAYANAYRALVLGDALAAPERDQFKKWLLATVTGGKRLRAGLPANWTTADKTGTGDYGTANDVAITWTDHGTPIVIAALSGKPAPDAKPDEALIADAAKVVAASLR